MENFKMLTELGEKIEEPDRQQCFSLKKLWGGASGKPGRTEEAAEAASPGQWLTYCSSQGAELGRGRGSGGQSLGRPP